MKYPTAVPPNFPQGDYTHTPKVEVFPNYTDPNMLQDDINLFLQAVIPLPDVRYLIRDIKYQCTLTGPPSNELRYSALMFYIEVVNI